MRIYFAGAHASGKSTLARYVSEHYNLPMITEVARMILSEKELQLDSLRANLQMTDDYQTDIFYRQLKEESKFSSFVSDRSFDCLAYAAQHSSILSKLLNSNELKEYIVSLKNDDVKIFFIRPSKATLKEDGVRESINWEAIIQIDAMIKFLIEMYNLKYYQINTDSMQERIRIIQAVL